MDKKGDVEERTASRARQSGREAETAKQTGRERERGKRKGEGEIWAGGRKTTVGAKKLFA